jgi:hypothetical protein
MGDAPWYGKAGESSTVSDSASPKFIMGGSDEQKFDHPTEKPVELMRCPILNRTKRGEFVYEPFWGAAPRWPRNPPSAPVVGWNWTRSTWM